MKLTKKLVLLGTTTALAMVAIPVSITLLKAAGDNSKQISNEITPTKPGKGETVSFLPKAVSDFYALNNLVETYIDQNNVIADLMPYSTEAAGWANYIARPTDYPRAIELYEKYDMYRPTNNLLAWDSKIDDVKEYKVIISQDSKLRSIEREYTVSENQNSVTFVNPYTGVTYYWQVIATRKDETKVFSDIFHFNVADLPRTIYVPGLSNTRDLGGRINKDGKKMKEGLIYRGNLLELVNSTSLDGKGMEELRKLGIKTDLSLRAIGEGADNPLSLENFYLCPSPYEVIFDINNAPLDDLSNIANVSGVNSNCKNFGNAIKALANKNNYPVYFHCAVGRDRTGFMGICLDFLCGMSEETTLKEFLLSLFSCAGAFQKGNLDFYNRYKRIRDYINTFDGANLSEKTENYLIKHCGVTHEDCQNVRDILLGEIDTGFDPCVVNENSYEGYSKVTFRRYGQNSIIKMVPNNQTIEDPNIAGNGQWYHGNEIWDFNTPITEDTFLDYIEPSKNKVVVHFAGVDKEDDILDLEDNTIIDFSKYELENYTYKVYDENFVEIHEATITEDCIFNIIYKSKNPLTPKQNSRVIVMAGQSNAAGVGHYQFLKDSLPEEKIKEINHGFDNVLMRGFSHRTMPDFKPVYADEDYNTCTGPGTFGFEVSLADRLSKIYPDETVYIVKYALGASNLAYDWCPPSSREISQATSGAYTDPNGKPMPKGALFDQMVDCVHESLDWIKNNTNTQPVLDAFMWMQGESDSGTYGLVDNYFGLWDNFIKDFKAEFSKDFGYKFAFYDAAISVHETWPLAREINQFKKSHEGSDYVYIDTVNKGYTTKYEPLGGPDVAHYDAGCYFDFGHFFADSYVKHNDPNYKPNELDVIVPERQAISLSDNTSKISVTSKFNGSVVDGYVKFFSRDTSILNIDENGVILPKKEGSTFVKVQVYYNGEITTKEVPVHIFEGSLEDIPLLTLADTEKIHYSGRNVITDDKVTFINTLSGFETKFVGKELKAKMLGVKGDNYYIPASLTLGIKVFVDDDEEGKIIQIKNTFSSTPIDEQIPQEVTLAQFDTVGTHTVKVQKVNYERRGYIELSGLYGPEEFISETDTRKKALILGDSITVGCGLNGKGSNDTYENENGTITYAAQFVNKNNLNAELMCVTGISLGAPAFWRRTIADIYKQYSYSYTDPYDFTKFVPDVIIINLGTNDAGVIHGGENQYGDIRTPDDVYNGALTLISGLREFYKNSSILFCFGMMGFDQTVASEIQKALNDYSQLYTSEFKSLQGFMKFNVSETSTNYGGHPTPNCNKKACEQLMSNNLIQKALGL